MASVAKVFIRVSLLALVASAFESTAWAQWIEVRPGIERRIFELSGPVRVHVARMDRGNAELLIDTAISGGRLTAGAEVVSAMAARRDGTVGAITADAAHHYDVAVAVNGSFFDTGTGAPVGGQFSSGWYVERYDDFQPSGFSWSQSDIFLGRCVRNRRQKQVLWLPGDVSLSIDELNEPEDAELTLFTRHYNPVLTPGPGRLVVAVPARPLGQKPAPGRVQATVVANLDSVDAVDLPLGTVAVRARREAAAALASLQPGDEIGFSQEITSLNEACSHAVATDWSATFAAVGGSWIILEGGEVVDHTNPATNLRNPRTAFAYNATHVFLVVVDGRSLASVGMTIPELALFLRDELGATHGINQDGGGSSTFWVDGAVLNSPSDGAQRPVANAILMVRAPRLPRGDTEVSGSFSARTQAPLRVGPGASYDELGTIDAGEAGWVVPHPGGGSIVDGVAWYLIAAGGELGFVPEEVIRDADAAEPATDGGSPGAIDAAVVGGGDAGSGQPGPGGGCAVVRAHPSLWFSLVILCWLCRRRRPLRACSRQVGRR